MAKPIRASRSRSSSRSAPAAPPTPSPASSAQHLSIALKQSVVVETRPGANGALAALYVARAAPDGYTLLMGTNSSHSAVPYPDEERRLRSGEGLHRDHRLGSYTLILVTHPSIPAKTIKELIAYAKANPKKLSLPAATPRRRGRRDVQSLGRARHAARALQELAAGDQ